MAKRAKEKAADVPKPTWPLRQLEINFALIAEQLRNVDAPIRMLRVAPSSLLGPDSSFTYWGRLEELCIDAKIAVISADGNISNPAESWLRQHRHENITLVMVADLDRIHVVTNLPEFATA